MRTHTLLILFEVREQSGRVTAEEEREDDLQGLSFPSLILSPANSVSSVILHCEDYRLSAYNVVLADSRGAKLWLSTGSYTMLIHLFSILNFSLATRAYFSTKPPSNALHLLLCGDTVHMSSSAK